MENVTSGERGEETRLVVFGGFKRQMAATVQLRRNRPGTRAQVSVVIAAGGEREGSSRF